ncbi:MAG: T9SS type A sorting domain-containing protein [Bacteroidales bacterium]|nr:T9SS type A sorting domain-containing protein [Bacteroidales bacterium]MCF8404447.1 T9SS type A sorting domain-containing protein [Bacteroidales bacterium]
MKKPISILFLLCISVAFSQQPMYFNKTYSNINYYAYGRSILEKEGSYIGYGYTNEPENEDKILFFEIDSLGEIVKWEPFPEQEAYILIVGGVMKQSVNGQYCLAYSKWYGGNIKTALRGMDPELNSLWAQVYGLGLQTIGKNYCQTSDLGYAICGSYYNDWNYSAQILLIKTDSLGNQQWYKAFGTPSYFEHGSIIIQTPDGGYLIGGYIYDVGVGSFHDALVMRIDSSGNLQWTKQYGSPNVDDDIALVAMATDGNYLLATVYGEWTINSDSRAGKIYLAKIDKDNGEIIWEQKIGEARKDRYIKSLKRIKDNHYMAAGWSLKVDTSAPNQEVYAGWVLKVDGDAETVWYRDYYYYTEQNDVNNLYDVTPTRDNGYIAIGTAHSESDTPQLWIIKLDSMLCDTPGCTTVVHNNELQFDNRKEIKVWPNPFSESFNVQVRRKETKGDGILRVFNSQGTKMEEQILPESNEIININSSYWPRGLYYIQFENSGTFIGASKILKQ